MSNGHTVTFTGDNLDDLTDLGVHVVPHATQSAAVVFAEDGDLDPIGTIAPGQVLTVQKDGHAFIAGIPDATVLPLPADDRFDPSKAKASEVLDYIREADDPAEVERVLQAERDGKNRTSIVGKGTPPAPVPAPEPPTVNDDDALSAPHSDIPDPVATDGEDLAHDSE